MRPYEMRPLFRGNILGDFVFHSRWPRRLHLLSTPLRSSSTPPLYLLPRPTIPNALPAAQRRNFWSRKRLASRESPNTTPGIRPIEKLVGSLNTQEGRPPPDEDLIQAFCQLVRSWRDGTVLDEHAHGLARTYEYLRTSPRGMRLHVRDLRDALFAVQHGTSAHQVGLARIMFTGIVAEGEVRDQDLLAFVQVLCNSGNTVEAVEVTRRHVGKVGEEARKRVWGKVLGGFAREGDEETLLQTWDLLKELGVEKSSRSYRPIIRFYCEKGDLETARVWYHKMLEDGLIPMIPTYVDILKACEEYKDLMWGREIHDMILNGGKKEGPYVVRKRSWDVALQWATVVGKGKDEIEKLLAIMTEASGDAGAAPDIWTINGLVRFAISRRDFEMVEWYLTLITKRGFEPNLQTWELKLEYKLLKGDIEGARVIYEELRKEDIPQTYEARGVKLLLEELCRQPEIDMQKIRMVYMDLNDWGIKLEVEHLNTLLNVFLEKCLFLDVIELLNRDCNGYSASDRRKVIHEIGEYIGRNTTSIEAAWDSYQILYQFFPEITVRQRTDIMRLFFELGRSDMATIVFHHMRGTPERRPNKYTYTIAFMGIAYSRDLEALKAVHNALKLDQLVDPDTRLTNSLMSSYISCGVPERALQFWEEIKKSSEGPDYTSISLALDSCGRTWNGGVAQARIVWGQLRSMGVKPTLGNYCSYVEALGRNDCWDDTLRIAKEMEELDGIRPNVKLLGTVYASMTKERRPEVMEWAKEAYPEEWQEVEERLKELPENVLIDEVVELLDSGPLQKLAQESQQMMAAIEEGERRGEEVRAVKFLN